MPVSLIMSLDLTSSAMVMMRAKCFLVLCIPYLLILTMSSCLPHATSLSFNYNFSSPAVLAGADLKYMNDSVPALGRIDLTNHSRSWSTGRVAHGQALRLWDDNAGTVASFTSTFTFAIKPASSNTARGDGMAFFVGPYPPSMPTDAKGGYLALFNNRDNPANTYFPPTVGVEFDTYKNAEWDPNDTNCHIGVNINNIRSIEYTGLPDGIFNGIMIASVRYEAIASTLSATLQFIDPQGQNTYMVNANVNLRDAGLPQDAAVGFSASIADFIEQHQILSWSFDSTMNDSKTKSTGLIAGLVSAGMFVLLAIATLLGYRQYLKRKSISSKDAEIPLEDMDNQFQNGAGPRRFSYSELSRATRRFSEEEKLGEGGFGAVYRGLLHDQGLQVAIKRVSKTSSQGRREYIAEVTIIGRLRHRNLVQLVGWCHKADKLLLVYELMTNDSLDVHLYNSEKILTWAIRHKIILDIGSALMYLHQEWDQCVVHRDIKPSNVMLDSSFNAKLGDFGLARLVDHSRDAHTTAVIAGTRGYMDPMYAVTRRASTETDVYSFGVVLLEVACGRRPVIQEEDEARAVLVNWVWQLYGRGKLIDAVDARIDGEFDAREVESVMVVGLWCVHPDYGCRPSIRQAMSVLQLEAPLPDLPPDMPVAIYVPPGGGHGSSYTSLNASDDTGGLSTASDQTAKSRSFAVAGTRSENDVTSVMNQAAGTTEHVQLRNYSS